MRSNSTPLSYFCFVSTSKLSGHRIFDFLRGYHRNFSLYFLFYFIIDSYRSFFFPSVWNGMINGYSSGDSLDFVS